MMLCVAFSTFIVPLNMTSFQAHADEGAAQQDSLRGVYALIESGDYEKAHDLAVLLETPDAYALAAESLARQVMLGEAEKLKKTSKKARKLAEMALEIDPSHQNARLQYVISDGFVIRLTGDVSAWMKKLPQKSFARIQAYRTDFPSDIRGDALLGAWHLAIARKAGNKNAEKWFEASIEGGIKLYDKALSQSPNDPVLLVNYAFALLALQEEDYQGRAAAKALLENSLTVTPKDDLSKKLILHAAKALELFEKKDDLRTYAEDFLDGNI